jgi:integrase
MFGWAVSRNLMKSNPARDAKPFRYASDGFHTWTLAEVQQFEARHPVGTKARLALALLLFTGARRGDVVTFGRQHIKSGWLSFVPNKTRHKRARRSEKPILPELAQIISNSPCGDLTLLVTEYGKPFTAAGFGGCVARALGTYDRNDINDQSPPFCRVSHRVVGSRRRPSCRRMAIPSSGG